VIELYGTDPKNNSDYSRIISPKAVERLAGLIDQKKVIAGGSSDPESTPLRDSYSRPQCRERLP
jgi:aldehyde dehydrogenase (NAD+)